MEIDRNLGLQNAPYDRPRERVRTGRLLAEQSKEVKA